MYDLAYEKASQEVAGVEGKGLCMREILLACVETCTVVDMRTARCPANSKLCDGPMSSANSGS
jgi:hypothetical protein